MTTYPELLKSANWKNKGELPVTSKVREHLKLLAQKHDAIDWKSYDGGWSRLCRTAATLAAASSKIESGWKSDAAALLKVTAGVRTAVTDTRKTASGQAPLLKALKSIDDALKGYEDSLKTMPLQLKKAEATAAEALEREAEDEDEDVAAGTLLDPKKLLAQLQQCRRDAQRRVQFALVDGGNKEAPMLVMHPRTASKTLFAKLQAETGRKAGSHGVAWVDESTLVLRPEKQFGGLAKKIRLPLKTAAFKVAKVIVLGPDDKAIEQDEEQDETAASAQQQPVSTASIADTEPIDLKGKALKPQLGDHLAEKETGTTSGGGQASSAAVAKVQVLAERFQVRCEELEALLPTSDSGNAGREALAEARKFAARDQWTKAIELLKTAESTVKPASSSASASASSQKAGELDVAFANALFGGDMQALAPFKQAFEPVALAEMYQAFGGEKGLTAVHHILRDVCRNDARRLQKLVAALG